MTYEELMSVHRQESRLTSLAEVSADFYKRTANYLDTLHSRCADRSESAEVSGMLLTQLKTAKEKSSEIYEARMRKIALMAMTSAFGAKPRLENATAEEKEAFESLKSFFLDHCKKTLSPECMEEETEQTKTIADDPMTNALEKDITSAPVQSDDDGRTEIILVRILEDLPAFAGSDKNYQLSKEDIISLPRNIAEILVKHNKAVEVKQSS